MTKLIAAALVLILTSISGCAMVGGWFEHTPQNLSGTSPTGDIPMSD